MFDEDILTNPNAKMLSVIVTFQYCHCGKGAYIKGSRCLNVQHHSPNLINMRTAVILLLTFAACSTHGAVVHDRGFEPLTEDDFKKAMKAGFIFGHLARDPHFDNVTRPHGYSWTTSGFCEW